MKHTDDTKILINNVEWNDDVVHREMIGPGTIVKHFKRDLLDPNSKEYLQNKYLYKVLMFATHTETDWLMVVYQALYPDEDGKFNVWVRPYESFMSKTNMTMYPLARQKFKFMAYDPESDMR